MEGGDSKIKVGVCSLKYVNATNLVDMTLLFRGTKVRIGECAIPCNLKDSTI